jgi:hypothetical protein
VAGLWLPAEQRRPPTPAVTSIGDAHPRCEGDRAVRAPGGRVCHRPVECASLSVHGVPEYHRRAPAAGRASAVLDAPRRHVGKGHGGLMVAVRGPVRRSGGAGPGASYSRWASLSSWERCVRGRSSMVERRPSKPLMRVRFPSPASARSAERPQRCQRRWSPSLARVSAGVRMRTFMASRIRTARSTRSPLPASCPRER